MKEDTSLSRFGRTVKVKRSCRAHMNCPVPLARELSGREKPRTLKVDETRDGIATGLERMMKLQDDLESDGQADLASADECRAVRR
jgi:hypothetical protein